MYILDELFGNSDLCSWITLTTILFTIGHHVVARHPDCRVWGIRLASLVCVLLGALAVGLEPDKSGHQLMRIAFRVLVLAGVILSASWIVLPTVAYVFSCTVGAAIKSVRDAHEVRERKALDVRRAREQAADRRQKQEDAERAARIRAKEEPVQRHAQQRRDEARTNCEIFYSIHAPEIGQRFTKEMFDDFVTRHMSDSQPPEHVEERARQLTDIMQRHLERIEPSRGEMTIEGLARWYNQMKKQIESQPIEQRYHNQQLAQLNTRYQELVDEVMQEMRP